MSAALAVVAGSLYVTAAESHAAPAAPVAASSIHASAAGDVSGSNGPGAARKSAVSSNWAGYAVTGHPGGVRHFDGVAGSWVQPAVSCTSRSPAYSAFWIGLGGLLPSSHKLEQTGTEADCDANGVAHYSAWYELVPAAPVTVSLAITPGDTISATVSVRNGHVTMTLADQTRGTSVSQRLRFLHPDTRSAEWIAEAPSDCNSGGCQPLPLTDFGTVEFTNASVHARNGQTGAIASPYWTAQPITLSQPTSATSSALLTPQSTASAAPTALATAGNSFAVTRAQS